MEEFNRKLDRSLRWSEKYMKTDMVYLAKGGFWLLLGQGVSMLSGLALVIAFANLLPKEVYGNYRYILSLAGVLSSFTLSGMGTAVTQAVARGIEGLVRKGFWIQLRWSIFLVLASFASSAYYLLNGNRVIGFSLIVVGLVSPFIESASLYSYYLNGKKDFRANAAFGAVRNVVPAAVLIATAFFTQDVVHIIMAYFLSHAGINLILYVTVLVRYRPGREMDDSSVGFSKHVSVTNILSIFSSYLDKILVFHFLGAVPLAVYGIAFSLPGQFKILVKTVSTLIFPKMSSVSIETIGSAIREKALRLFVGFGLLVLTYILLAPFIFRLFFPQYLEAIIFSQVLALGYLFSPSILYSQAFFAHKREREIYILKIVTSFSRILLLVALLPPFGIWGAVWTFILTNAIGFSTAVVLFMRLRTKKEDDLRFRSSN